MTFVTEYGAWDSHQAALAICRFNHAYPPTEHGLRLLMKAWRESGAPPPGSVRFEGVEYPMDMGWAGKAMLDVYQGMRP